MNQNIHKCLILIISILTVQALSAREDSWPQSIPAHLPLYSKGTPRIHYNIVPQYNLFEDNLMGPVDSCAVYKMKEQSEWGEITIVKDYLWLETSYTPQGYRKQRKQYYLYEGNRDNRHLEFIENYIGNPNIVSINVMNFPEDRYDVDLYTFSIIDEHHKDVLLTRSSGEQSMWKSNIDPQSGIFELKYFATKSSEPDTIYTNFFGSVYTHKGSSWLQTLKNIFNEREIMHTDTRVYALNDGLFLTPPYSGIGEYNLFQNNDTQKIVRISPTQTTIEEGITRVKHSAFDRDIAYCTIDIEYNSHGDYSKISFVEHELIKSKKPNNTIGYTWNEKVKWSDSFEYEYDSHGNWILLKHTDSNGTHFFSQEIIYAD